MATLASFRIATLPGSLVRSYLRRSRERTALATLDGLSDATLRDIGLERYGIRDAVRHGIPGRM